MTRKELQNKMAVLLGGRAAEVLIFGEISTGAQDDLAKATDIARSMVTRYGMNAELGQVSYERDRAPFLGDVPGYRAERDFSEETAREIDCAVRALVETAHVSALEILERRRAKLEAGAATLLEQETLTQDELKLIIGGSDDGADREQTGPSV